MLTRKGHRPMTSPRTLGIALACASLLAHAAAFARPTVADVSRATTRNATAAPVSTLAAHTANALDRKMDAPLRLLLERAGAANPAAAASASAALVRDPSTIAIYRADRSPYYVLPLLASCIVRGRTLAIVSASRSHRVGKIAARCARATVAKISS